MGVVEGDPLKSKSATCSGVFLKTPDRQQDLLPPGGSPNGPQSWKHHPCGVSFDGDPRAQNIDALDALRSLTPSKAQLQVPRIKYRLTGVLPGSSLPRFGAQAKQREMR